MSISTCVLSNCQVLITVCKNINPTFDPQTGSFKLYRVCFSINNDGCGSIAGPFGSHSPRDV